MTALLFFKYIGLQLVVTLVLLLAGFGIDGRDGVLATGLGSLIAILPNAYFCLQAFRYKASEDPVRALGALYRGEAGKFVLVMVLCALTFRFYELHNPLLLFIALLVILVTQTVASVMLLPSLNGSQEITQLKKLDSDELDH